MDLGIFKQSFSEFKSVKNLCIISLLMAMQLVVATVGTIKINEILEVRFGFLVYMIVGTMFGPFISVIFGFFADVIWFFLFSGGSAPFGWGFTISSMLSGLIYGTFLYKFKLEVKRVAVLQIIHDIIIGFLLNTFTLSFMYFGGDFAKCFFLRLPKQCITLPLNCVLAVLLSFVFLRVAKGLKILH